MSRDVTYIQAAQTGFKSQSSQNTLDCLAVTIGHSSRIWGLRFISSSENEWSLMSFGEDSTCQTWRLVPKVSSSGSREEDELHTHSLIPLQTYKYHTGKNLWGAKVFNSINAKCVVSTGGADGRVVLYQIPCSGSQSNAIQVYSWTSESSLVDLTTTTRADPPCLNTEHRPQHSPSQGGQAFTSLIGCWELHRLLESALPAYPSGVFKGIAVMTTRCPTDPAYDAEYLYEESGTLTTQQGLLLKGSRKYVYRYQKDLDAITAWFVKPDANITVDYLFHNFSFEATDKGYPGNPTSTAKGHHLCVEDEYDVYYTFNYEREILKNWTLRYDVKGPYKNYVAKATYIRTSGDQHSNVSVTKAIDMAEGHELLTGTNTKYGSLKTYCWTGFHNLISTTANGYVVIASLESGNKNDSLPNPSPTVLSCSQQIPWVLLGYIPDLESFSVVVSIANDIVLFGSATGRIYMYQNFTRSINPLSKVPGKVSSIYGISIYRSSGDIAVAAIVSCLGDPFSYYVSVDANGHVSGDTPNRIPLELPSSFVVTSACFVELEQLIILGSRGGALSFYDHNMTLSTSLRTSCCCIRKIHGEDAVTVIKVVPCKDPDLPGLYLLTAGRDGRFAVHLLSVERENGMICIKFETVHVAEPLSGSNIEGANFDSINGDILIWGFHSTEFVVYNETKQKDVVKIPCGGSHRSWAYRPNLNGTGGGRFVWTKASTCNVLVQLEASHLVLNPGGHGREIKAMSFCPVTCQLKGRISRLVATGAEDTIIRITGYHCEAGIFGEKFQNLGIIHDHKTGIQQLQWSPDGKYLFSAGGREEFYIWRIRSVPGIGVGFVRVAQGPPITESSELRVMDFDITTMNQNISDPP
ncbi:hypothetical protein MMC19_000884, partial [Ptychographa xylographoides]|nr:hypothetical protein [Ptychographa xylographoides]